MPDASGPLLLGLDLGTSGIRCIVFSEVLKVLSSAYLEYPLIFGPQGEIEQDAEQWYELSLQVISESLKGIEDPSAVQGLSISSQGISFVAVNEDFQPLRSAISWLDMRGESYLPEISKYFSQDEMMKRTGKIFSGAYTLPKLLWLRHHEPEIWRSTRHILLPMDYVLGKMTGNYLTDHTLASGTMCYSILERCWDNEILERLEIDSALMPPICESGTAAGTLLPEVADRLGLRRDIVVSVGGQDQKCASLAAGIGSDTLTLSLGTAAALEMLLDHPVADNKRVVPSFSYLFNDQWVGEGVVNTAGAALRWFVKGILHQSEYTQINEQISMAYPRHDAGFFIPGLSRQSGVRSSSFWPCEPSGVFWGLSLSTNQADMVRMVLEGVTFEVELMRRNMMLAFSTGSIKRIRVFGGGANSAPWCRMIADTTGLVTETLSTHETAAAGAAILAGMGSGMYKNGFKAAKMIRPARLFEPDLSVKDLMIDKLEKFSALKKKLYEQEEDR